MTFFTVHRAARSGITVRGVCALAIAVAISAAIPVAGAAASPIPEPIGLTVTPTQPFDTTTDSFATQPEWLGAFDVHGTRSWATSFALGAPDPAVMASPELAVTKWQGRLTAEQKLQLSTLLVLHGAATSNEEAAAVEVLILEMLSGPNALGHQPGQDTDPSRTVDAIAFDKSYALSKIAPAVATEAARLDAESQALAGSWTLKVTAPATAKVGTASNWTVSVGVFGAGVNVPNRSVTLTATQGRFANGTNTITVSTQSDGSAATVPLTPTGSAPSVTASSEGPAIAPRFLEPFNGDTPDTSRSPYLQENEIDLSDSGSVTATGGGGGTGGTGGTGGSGGNGGTGQLALTGGTVPLYLPFVGGGLVLLGVAALVDSRRRRRVVA